MKKSLPAILLVLGCSGTGAAPDETTADSSLTGNVTLTCTTLTFTAGHGGGGQTAANLATAQLTGTKDVWNDYVEFSSGSDATCTFALPAGTPASAVSALTVVTNYRGPAKSAMLWQFDAWDYAANAWVNVGDNGFAADWVWTAGKLALPSPVTRFVSGAGQLKVRYHTSSTNDASDLDQLVLGASIDQTSQDAGAEAGQDASGDAGGSDGATDAGGGDAQTDAGGGGPWWRPDASPLPWQWEIDHEISTTSATDMGTGEKTYAGGAAADPVVYDIDGFDNTAADVAKLHALGKKVICYVEVGAAESYRSDYAQFPAAALGKLVDNYPQEKYLDIRNATVVSVIEARIAMCKQKGFDAIEPDIDDSYTDDTGFPISMADNVAFLKTLSSYAHGLGLAWGLKNGADGGDPAAFVGAVLPVVDFAVVEEPFFLKTIGFFEPAFSGANKALFVAEYTNDTTSASSFCPAALAQKTNAALFDLGLDGKVRTPCQ
jgi:cysteinyl-tRNA synthetase